MCIDLHCHIIWGVDDGAQTEEDAQNMLRAAYEDGTDVVVCTSHISPGLALFPEETYQSHLASEQAWLQQEGIPLQLVPGHEVFYTDHTARMLQEGLVHPLGNSPFVLVEFSPDTPYERIREGIQKITMGGYRVLIAHFERYHCLRNLAYVEELRQRYGCFMQMNGHTVIRRQSFFANRWLKQVMARRLVDAIASDAHNTTHRATCMAQAFRAVSDQYGDAMAQRLFIDRPSFILNGM